MKKVLKWIGIVLGAILGLIVLLVLGLFMRGSLRLSQVYNPPPDNITIPTDAASIARGKHIANIVCIDCHGADLGGKIGWFNFPPAGQVDSANLTSGQGGIGKTFTDADYVRVLRHGVDEQGHGTFMVAALTTQNMSDADLGAVVAYVKTVPPVDRVTNGMQFTPLARVLLGAGVMPWPADMVSNNGHISAPAPGVNVEYGKYLVDSIGCRDCHSGNLAGGPYPEPGTTFTVPNITPGSETKSWTDAQFIQTIRTGVTPSGHQFVELMPWKTYNNATDDELKAIWMYIQSQPPLPQNK